MVPIIDVPCGTQFNQPRPVVGVRHLQDHRTWRATGNNKGISMDGICTTDQPGRPGGEDLGTYTMALVN